MTFSNGRALPVSLRTIRPGFALLSPTSYAWDNMALVHHMLHHVLVTPASEYGSGYRSIAVQQEFYRAGQGDRAAILKTHLDPNLKVSIATPGSSTHGWANRADTLFNGRSPDAIDLAFVKLYGMDQEFGSADRNHFRHDKVTAISGVRNVHRVRLTAEFLNERHLGRTTRAADTGNQNDHDFTWLVQHWGHLQHSYPTTSPEDGDRGPNTDHSLHVTWDALMAAWKRAHPIAGV